MKKSQGLQIDQPDKSNFNTGCTTTLVKVQPHLKNNPIQSQEPLWKLTAASQMPACGSDTNANLILSQFQSIGATLALPTVTGAMFVCGDMAP